MRQIEERAGHARHAAAEPLDRAPFAVYGACDEPSVSQPAVPTLSVTPTEMFAIGIVCGAELHGRLSKERRPFMRAAVIYVVEPGNVANLPPGILF